MNNIESPPVIVPLATLEEISIAVYENAIRKGFHDFNEPIDRFIDSQTNNLHNEVSELHEAWRNGKFNAECDKSDKMREILLPPLTCAEEEYADIIIRCLDQCRRLGINIQRAIEIKHAYNTTRPHKHSGKLS